MPFRPKVNETIQIDKIEYRFVEHPSSQGVPYALAGERSTIYQLQDEHGERYALKVFTLAYRSPQIAQQAEQIAALQSIPGLEACRRRVIIPAEQAELVITHPELRYAVLMPWLPGHTLEELFSEEDTLTHEQRLMAAKKLAETLAQIEAQGMVHGNLKPSNLLVDLSASNEVAIHLVGLEGISSVSSGKSEESLLTTSENEPLDAEGSDFEARSDRLTGAMLIAALLSGEMVQDDESSQERLSDLLDDEWGSQICDLFELAITSMTPTDCPPFSHWVDALGKLLESQEIIERKQDEPNSDNQDTELIVVFILAAIIIIIVVLVLIDEGLV